MDENEILKRQFANAPKDIQNLIRSSSFDSQIQRISQKYILNSDQTSSLEDEIIFVLVGLEQKNNLTGNIEHELNLPHQTALIVGTDVENYIFTQVRESLDGINNTLTELDREEATENNSLNRKTLMDEIENPHPSEMKTVTSTRATAPAGSAVLPSSGIPGMPTAPMKNQTPQNLPTMPEHHELMKYYAGTEPIMPEQIDYSGPVPLKKKDQPKLADTPRYDKPRYSAGDPYREPPQ